MARIIYFLLLTLPLHLYGQMIYTVGGNGSSYYFGDGGPATAAQISYPYDVAVAKSGNLYIADNTNLVIRKINAAGIISTVAGNHLLGSSTDGVPATATSLGYVTSVAVDLSENLYIPLNNAVRKVNNIGIISTVAGGGTSLADGIPATNATLSNVYCVTLDKYGNLYIADNGHAKIRKVNTAGIITTVAGNGIGGDTGDGGPATAARISSAHNMKVDDFGNIYLANYGSMIIRKISASGIISTVAGNGYLSGPGVGGYSGDGGPATAAKLSGPSGVAVDKFGNIYISDFQNHIVRKVDTFGIINTISGYPGATGYGVSGIRASSCLLRGPVGMDVDTSGNLYFADCFNFKIHKIIVSCLPSIISGPTSLCVGSSMILVDSISGGTWSATNSRATVSSSGVVTAVSNGIDTIRYTLNNVCGVNSASKIISLQQPVLVAPITGVDSVCIGSTVTLADATVGGTWGRSNMNASVTPGGIVTGISPGKDTLSYTITNSCGVYQQELIMKVNPLPVIYPIVGPDSVCVGSVISLSDSAIGGIWGAKNTRATIVGGNVTGHTPGIDTITYTITQLCTVQRSKTIEIKPLPYAGVIEYSDLLICKGNKTLIVDTVSGGVWSRSNFLAGLSITPLGLEVTGLESGIDTISYSKTNSCGTATTSIAVTINPLPDAGVVSGPSDVCVGSVIVLSDSVAGGIWTATNNNASVLYGVVSGVAQGLDTIFYTVFNSCGVAKAMATVSIHQLPVAGTIEFVNSTMCVGDSISLINTVQGGVWESTNHNATVSEQGIVNGISDGTDVISYSVNNFCGTATSEIMITINPVPVVSIERDNDVLSTQQGNLAYLWVLNGNRIPNATSNPYHYTDTGTYSVIVTNSYGCSSESSPVSISDCSIADILVSPNPTYGIIYINWCKKLKIEISSVNGNKIKVAENVYQIDVSDLPNGIYSITLFNESNKKLLTKRISKI